MRAGAGCPLDLARVPRLGGGLLLCAAGAGRGAAADVAGGRRHSRRRVAAVPRSSQPRRRHPAVPDGARPGGGLRPRPAARGAPPPCPGRAAGPAALHSGGRHARPRGGRPRRLARPPSPARVDGPAAHDRGRRVALRHPAGRGRPSASRGLDGRGPGSAVRRRPRARERPAARLTRTPADDTGDRGGRSGRVRGAWGAQGPGPAVRRTRRAVRRGRARRARARGRLRRGAHRCGAGGRGVCRPHDQQRQPLRTPVAARGPARRAFDDHGGAAAPRLRAAGHARPRPGAAARRRDGARDARLPRGQPVPVRRGDSDLPGPGVARRRRRDRRVLPGPPHCADGLRAGHASGVPPGQLLFSPAPPGPRDRRGTPSAARHRPGRAWRRRVADGRLSARAPAVPRRPRPRRARRLRHARPSPADDGVDPRRRDLRQPGGGRHRERPAVRRPRSCRSCDSSASSSRSRTSCG